MVFPAILYQWYVVSVYFVGSQPGEVWPPWEGTSWVIANTPVDATISEPC